MLEWHDTPWMWLSMVAFWSLFALFAYYAIVGMGRSSGQSSPRATEILKERYARGEITDEEYRERIETLTTAGSPKRDQ